MRSDNKARYHKCDKDKRRATLRAWQDSNREYVNAYARKRRNPDESFVPKGRKLRFYSHTQASERSNKHYHANKAHFHEYNRKRNQRPDVKAKRAAQELKRLHENLDHRIRCSLAKRINAAIKSGTKSARTMELLGCSINLFRQWIAHQFWRDMSWENYGAKGWHIDHIRPCASFDLTDPEEQRKCFHWTNMQPLWAKDNCSKRDTILPILDYQI